MSFDKAIESGKEHRKPYRGGKNILSIVEIMEIVFGVEKTDYINIIRN